jgi:hypothetical protein
MRAKRILCDVIDSLVEFYEALGDTTFAAEIASTVQVPDTGNDQFDYETTKLRYEKNLNKALRN